MEMTLLVRWMRFDMLQWHMSRRSVRQQRYGLPDNLEWESQGGAHMALTGAPPWTYRPRYTQLLVRLHITSTTQVDE